jgi:SAM-dependent methyltransferase
MWRDFSRANALNPAQRHRWRLILREIARRNARHAAPTVVDLGCGSGTLLGRIGRAVPAARLVGLDIETRALELARRAVPRAEFHQVDLSGEEPDPGPLAGSADVAVCSEVLEHLDNPGRAVRLARSLLKPDGLFVVTVPAGPITAFDRAIGHVRHYDLAAVESLLTAGGFDVVRLYRWGYPFHTLFRIAVGMCPDVPAQFTDDRVGRGTEAAFRLLNVLFYLNAKSRRVGRQIVAAAVPRRAS